MKDSSFTAYIEQDEDGMFIGSVPSVPSCYAQGKTQKEMLNNLQDVLRLCLRNFDARVLGGLLSFQFTQKKSVGDC